MLTWDAEVIGGFLGARAIFEDNSSYKFSFPMFGRDAHLQIFPETNEVILTIGNLDNEHVEWRLDCSEISYNDDRLEEGADCLVFKPLPDLDTRVPTTHWVVMGRNAAGFHMFTVFRAGQG